MKKKVILRSLIGMPIGVTIGIFIILCISYSIGDGNFHAVSPKLIGYCGNEINAFFWQFIAMMIYGAVWSGSSTIWDMEGWSIFRQTVTHFLILSLTTLPTAYFMCWVNHSLFSVVTYFAVFAVVYVIIWLSQYIATKRKLNKLNKMIKEIN